MLHTTFDAFKAIMRGDPLLRPQDQTMYLQALRLSPDVLSGLLRSAKSVKAENNAPVSLAEPRILRRKQVAERLGRSIRSVDALAKVGIIHKIRLPGRTRSAGILSSEIDRLLAGGEGMSHV